MLPPGFDVDITTVTGTGFQVDCNAECVLFNIQVLSQHDWLLTKENV